MNKADFQANESPPSRRFSGLPWRFGMILCAKGQSRDGRFQCFSSSSNHPLRSHLGRCVAHDRCPALGVGLHVPDGTLCVYPIGICRCEMGNSIARPRLDHLCRARDFFLSRTKTQNDLDFVRPSLAPLPLQRRRVSPDASGNSIRTLNGRRPLSRSHRRALLLLQ